MCLYGILCLYKNGVQKGFFSWATHVIFTFRDSTGRYDHSLPLRVYISTQSFVQLVARIPLSCQRRGWRSGLGIPHLFVPLLGLLKKK